MAIVMMWWYGNGWGGWLVMVLMTVAFWGLLITGVVALVRYFGGSGRGNRWAAPGAQAGGNRPEDVLAERYARGEIDEDEYRRRLTVLREHP